jgi:hypothetical protein
MIESSWGIMINGSSSRRTCDRVSIPKPWHLSNETMFSLRVIVSRLEETELKGVGEMLDSGLPGGEDGLRVGPFYHRGVAAWADEDSF